jgi:hypothetical protein
MHRFDRRSEGARLPGSRAAFRRKRSVQPAALLVLALLGSGGQHAAALPPAQLGAPERVVHVAAGDPPRLTLAPTIIVAPNATSPLPIALESVAPLPIHSYVRLRGLPPAITLSDGYAIGQGVWAVPLRALGGLTIEVPPGLSGRSEVIVSVHTEYGVVLSQIQATLIVAAAPVAAPAGEPFAESAPMAQSQREAVATLIARGEQGFQQADLALARALFERAAEAGSARAALLMAETYDANALGRHGIQGALPDPMLARQWYQRARSLGAPEADERLSRLDGS